MSAVSKRLIPESRVAATTSAVLSVFSRLPKLLVPRPTTVTSSDPMRLLSTVADPSHNGARASQSLRQRVFCRVHVKGVSMRLSISAVTELAGDAG